MRKFVVYWRSVVATSELIAFIDVEEVIAEIFQALGKKLRVGKSRTLGDAEVVGSPTPPANGRWSGDSRAMKSTNNVAVTFELIMIVGREAGRNVLGSKSFA